MNDCYNKYYKHYDWILFYDIDEYIHLCNYTNIKYFLNEKKFSRCQLIYLNLILHTDNNHIYYENKSLFERFPERVSPKKTEGKRLEVKFILKGHIPNIQIKNQHYCNYNLKGCNGFGIFNSTIYIHSKSPDFYYNYIDHFYSKSTEEFIDKIIKGDCRYINSQRILKIKRYFYQSKMNEEKVKLIEKRLNINLSEYNITLNK